MEQLDDINEVTLTNIIHKIADEMHDWIIISNAMGQIIYVNDVVKKDCGCSNNQVLGEDLCLFVGVDLADEDTINHIQIFINEGEKYEFITKRQVKDGHYIYLANTLMTVWVNDSLGYYVCVSKDITNNLVLKEEFYKMSYTDPITGYPNQKTFLDRVEKQMLCAKQNDKSLAVMLFDICDMEEINARYGMKVGNLVVREIGNRIKALLEPEQEIFKCYSSTFAVLLQGDIEQVQVEEFVRAVERVTSESIHIQTRYIHITLRGGIAFYTYNMSHAEELIECAQVALLHAKKQTKSVGTYVYYSKTIHQEADNLRRFESDLEQAVENDEFIVYYQPFVELGEERLVGMEALVRRRRPNGEIIAPGEFIDALERMHLIEKVGLRVLEIVCAQIRSWLEQGYPVVPVSVNLSALQFKNPSLAEDVKGVLERYDIAPNYIVLEITETTLMEDISDASKIVDELRAYGFAISIDDFGTGYASIGYLKKFMFDHLKIDISFIREIAANKENRAIVEAIIAIAKTLKLTTIAEGIESEEQLRIMHELGCEMGQGYFWEKPISANKIEEKYFTLKKE